jgi:hypothetical protein
VKNTIVVTTADLEAKDACGAGLEWWEQHFPEGRADFDVVLEALLEDDQADYACWLTEAYGQHEFTFDELDDGAKLKATEALIDDIDYSCLYEYFVRAGEMIGVEFKTRRGTRSEPCIWWSGFYHQGSGLGFDGTYRYAKGAPKAVAKEWPQDEELHRIAVTMQEAQRPHFYRLYASIDSVRDTSISVEVEDGEDPYKDVGDAKDEIKEAMEGFAHWMYRRIQDEYEWQISEENVRDLCEANGYIFDKYGRLL